MKNYYQILGIGKKTGDEEIKRVYRKLALDYHPDRHGGDDSRFKEISEAYAILKDPVKRAAYDLDLKKAEMAEKPRANSSHTATTTSDFGGASDPGSQRGMWDDSQSNDRDGYRRASTYTAGRAPKHMGDVVGHWIKPVSTVLFGVAVLILFGMYVFRAMEDSGSDIPTITPQPQSNSNSQTYNPPSVGAGGNYSTPSPTATPDACPTGQPSITAYVSSNSQGSSGTYTISGTVTNDSTATININSVGFYFGQYDKNIPPDVTDTFEDMVATGRVPIAPGDSVQWSSTQNGLVPGQDVTASLDYPEAAGDQITPEWYFTGSVPQNCQPQAVSSN